MRYTAIDKTKKISHTLTASRLFIVRSGSNCTPVSIVGVDICRARKVVPYEGETDGVGVRDRQTQTLAD